MPEPNQQTRGRANLMLDIAQCVEHDTGWQVAAYVVTLASRMTEAERHEFRMLLSAEARREHRDYLNQATRDFMEAIG